MVFTVGRFFLWGKELPVLGKILPGRARTCLLTCYIYMRLVTLGCIYRYLALWLKPFLEF